MHWFVTALLLVSLLLVVWQDFRERKIHVFVLLFLTIVAFLNSYLQQLLDWQNVTANSLFVILLISLVFIFLRLRVKLKWKQLFDEFLGLGDVLFWLAIVGLFSFFSFAVFLSISFIFSAIVHLMVLLLTKGKNKLIPLAGYQAVCLMFLYIYFEIIQSRPLFHFASYIYTF